MVSLTCTGKFFLKKFLNFSLNFNHQINQFIISIPLIKIVDGARPRSTITWFNRSQPVQQSPVENTELMEDGTYRTSSTLVFIATRFDHQTEFFCKGTNDVLKSKNEVPLLQATQLQVLCKFDSS